MTNDEPRGRAGTGRRATLLLALLGGCGAATPVTDAGPADARERDAAPPEDRSDAGAPDVAADAPDEGVAADVPPAGPDDPITDATPNRWTWVPIEGARCLNGSPTGIGVNVAPGSDGLVIFFMGGGACFNAQTCSSAFHADGFGETAFRLESTVAGAVGPMARGDANNPTRGWSYVYIGYCTGDVHAGDNTAGVEIDGARYVFTGHRNVRLALRRLVPTFRDVRRILMTGVSAGGFGASYNYDQVATAFGPSVDVSLVDDSGPPLADDQLAPCLQRTWRTLWNLDATLPADCTACRAQADGGGLVNLVDFLARKYPSRRLGLISSTGDDTIRNYFSWGRGGDCNRQVPMNRTDFLAGLLGLRRRTAGLNFRTYFIESNNHTWLFFPDWNGTRVGGVPLSRWVGAIATGEGVAADVGPAAP
jgi:hypothetical protein